MCFTSENRAVIKNNVIGRFWTLCVTLKPLVSLFDRFIYLTLCAVQQLISESHLVN